MCTVPLEFMSAEPLEATTRLGVQVGAQQESGGTDPLWRRREAACDVSCRAKASNSYVRFGFAAWLYFFVP